MRSILMRGTLQRWNSAYFVNSPYQRGHGIGSFLGGFFRKILSYLNKDAVEKEASCACELT